MRKTIVSVAGLAGLLFSAVGCMDLRTAILLEKDGSGAIEQTLYVKPPPAMPGMTAPQETTPEEDLQRAKAKSAEAASKMGEVLLKSVEPLAPRGAWKGFKTVYTFTDISKVRLSTAPHARPGTQGEDKSIRFAFTKEPSSKLTVTMPPLDPSASEAGPNAKPGGMGDPGPMFEAMLPSLLEGARIEFLIKVNGQITKTDAAFVSMKRDAVGLIRADLDGLSKDPAAMDAVKPMLKIKDPKAIQEKLQDPALKRYLKFETKPKIEIEFN